MGQARRRKGENTRADLLKDKPSTIRDSPPPPSFIVFLTGCFVFLLFITSIVLTTIVSSYAVTDTFTWGYKIDDIKRFPVISFLFPPVSILLNFILEE